MPSKPKFTDTHKYPRGYTDANATNIAQTFARIRREQAEAKKAVATAVVRPIKRGKP